MEIIPVISRDFDSNVYLLIDEVVALIDTGAGTDKEIKRRVDSHLGNRRIEWIVNTHAHIDHVGGNSFFKGAKVFAHESDVGEMDSGNLYGTYGFIGQKIKVKVDEVLRGGTEIDIGELVLEVIHTPGHTPGSICLYERDKKLLFSGDTLFPNGNFGRVDFKGGNMSELINSLKKLQAYDFESIYPGHMDVVNSGRKHLKRSLKNAIELGSFV